MNEKTARPAALAAVALLALAGCAAQPPAPIAEQCIEFGWEPGTDGHAQCRQDLAMQARDARIAEDVALTVTANQAARAWALSMRRRR